jgi:hypothetical protein
MSNKDHCVGHAIRSFGGELVKGDTRFDGKLYGYRSVWDEEEDANKFLGCFADNQIVSARTMIDGYLTVFFSIL